MNLYLIGYRGSGKSSVAPLLAKELIWDWVDTDEQIQVVTGQTIAEIFAEQGEIGFREWETTIVQAYAQKKELVVSLGGGAPTVPAIADFMKRSGSVVYLKATASELWNRISADTQSSTQRPNLTDLDGLDEVEKLLRAREGIYNACADWTIDTTNKPPQQVATEIANWWDPVDM